MKVILHYIINSIPYMLCAIPAVVLSRIIVNLFHKALKINWWHEVGLLLFAMFCVGAASQTVIPKLEFGGTAPIVNGNLFGEINLIPGKVFFDTYNECVVNENLLYFIINFIGNICLFIPIGFGLSLLWNNMTIRKTILIALLASLFIELGQLPQARGTDIDDIWINILGALIGYWMYNLVIRNRKVYLLSSKFKYTSKT